MTDSEGKRVLHYASGRKGTAYSLNEPEEASYEYTASRFRCTCLLDRTAIRASCYGRESDSDVSL